MKDIINYNLIAHRGYYNKYIKENTISAFRKAIIFNYIIELDIYLKDNDIIVTHLYKLNHIYPKLSEVLNLVSGKVPIIIDIKDINYKIVFKLIELLDKYKGSFIIISFNPFILLLFKLYRSNYKRGLLLLYDYKIFKTPLFIKMINPNYLFLHYKYYDDNRIKKLKNKIPIIGFTITNKEDYFKYKNYFDNLVCDIYKIK